MPTTPTTCEALPLAQADLLRLPSRPASLERWASQASTPPIRTMSSRLLPLFLAVGLGVGSSTAWACGIVYGKDWAFVADTPAGWSSACHKQAMEGTAITLWPAAQRPASSDSLIYVTVSAKELPTLHAFASDAIARFKASAPTVRVSELEPPTTSPKVTVEMVAFSGAPPGTREELVAYIEGPTAYFIAVLTSESAPALASRRTDFLGFVSKFVPMERR